MGSSHSIRSTHFQRPTKDANVENIAEEEFDDQRSISITNKMVERLVEDATLAGGAAPAALPPKPKVEYRDKIYSEKLKCMDDSHSERCRMGYPRELCELLSEVNSVHEQIGDICTKQGEIFTFISHCQQKIDECNENLDILNKKLISVETRVSHQLLCLTNLIPIATYSGINSTKKETGEDDHSKVTAIQSPSELVPPSVDVFTTPERNQEISTVSSNLCKQLATFNHSLNNGDLINHSPSTSDELTQEDDNGKETKEVYHDTENQHALICDSCGCSKTAINEKKFIHLCNITADSNDIKAHLRHLCANRRCSVQQINSRGNNKSYKIGVPIDLYEKVISPKIWPENALIRPWVSFRRNRQH